MDAARLLETLNHQGLTLIAQGAQLIVKPGNLLTANDETLIRQHKPELLRLLRTIDVETLLHALIAAGPAGLDWREGTPVNWSGDRLLDAGEVLYREGRMVNVLGRRYLPAQAPRLSEQWSSDTAPPQATPQATPQIVPTAPTSGSAAASPHREQSDNPQAARIAELIAAGWSPWNAKARAESETLPGWQHPPAVGVPVESIGCE